MSFLNMQLWGLGLVLIAGCQQISAEAGPEGELSQSGEALSLAPSLFGNAAHARKRHHPPRPKHPIRNVQVGPRPYYLVDDMDEGSLKNELSACSEKPLSPTKFSIGHRGAALQFPEHTRESYEAAARMGAGIIECDVTFTADKELVCRHSQCDLHTTTNILATPLADKCTRPFTPADPETGTPASALCCTSDITLDEFKSLCGKMDAADASATTVEEYLGGTPNFRTDLYSTCGTVMTHQESIALIDSLGADFTPELKTPSVEMPFDGDYSQEAFAQQMLDEYKAARIKPSRVWAQSFLLDDVLYWVENEPSFGRQAVFLDGRDSSPDFDFRNPATWSPSMAELRQAGVRVIAPPMWMLLDTDDNAQVVPSLYARTARRAGLDIIAWTLERSGPLSTGGGWYHQSITDAINNDGDTYTVLDVLARRVGVRGIFSDWPGTTTYYANCFGF